MGMVCIQYVFLFLCSHISFYLIKGHLRLSQQGSKKHLTWQGKHANKTFMEIIETVFENDKMLIDWNLKVKNLRNSLNGNTVFIYPYGICVNFVEYNPEKEFIIEIEEMLLGTFKYENMLVFITDPEMMTYSSVDLQSHQGNQIFGLKKDRKIIYDVEVLLKDYDNPAEKKFCSLSFHADCVVDQTYEIISKVRLSKKLNNMYFL